jgi:hypothetical protein
MFKVYEMSSNFSKKVAMFENEVDAYEYCEDRASENTVSELGCDIASDDLKAYEMEYENQMSYFSIKDDGREPMSKDSVVEQYNDMLDDCYPEMFNMCASVILERADTIAYSCGLNDYYDSISDSHYCEEME